MSDQTKEILTKGLTNEPKYIPAWYRYDEEGSRLNDMCINESKWYYFHREEVQLIETFVQDLVNKINGTICVDLGSGNAQKTKILLNNFLQKERSLTYIPVDISEEYLKTIVTKVREEYANKVEVHPLGMEYLEAIEKIRLMKGNKLYVWFGSLQSLPYQEQIRYCKALSNAMQESMHLPLKIRKGERIFLHEGDAISHKYTIEQLKHIFHMASLEMVEIWNNTHVGAFLLKTTLV